MCRADLTRLKKCIRRAEQGDELVIAFLGGSITQGSLAAKPENTYAYRVYNWWRNTFPNAQFHYVNGGIGGTTSHYGAARAISDVLMYQPDFVVVDFSVNDEANEFFQETYEGVVRKILSWDSMPAVLLLNNVRYDDGGNAQEYHNAVGEWYGVPYVSIKDTVYQRMKAGQFSIEELTPDCLHPNDFGHQLVAGEIISFLEQVKGQADQEEGQQETGDDSHMEKYTLPAPMTANAYENALRLTIQTVSPKLSGFRADTEEKTGHLDHFKNGWIGKKAGDAVHFELEASCIAVQYRKAVHKPALRAELILDGDREHPVLLDGNFEEDWGDCLYLEPVLHHGKRMRHTVDISILPFEISAEDMTPFYLMAVIVA